MEEDEILQQNGVNEEEETEESNENSSPKITFIELILFPLPLSIIADLVDLISWTGIGTMISWGLDILSAGSLTLYLFLRGLRGEFMLLSGVVEMIPGIDFLPIRTATLLLLYFKQKNPNVDKTIEKLGKIIKK
ncbi:MAG TPA: hypothetical protein PK168_00380 [Candidatus Paceibacterota bacterium]|jgi:hypothetical protein|nr:hypothetical protein [Parcubacteria group bacterium]HOM33049.1 hypothetical protein [Candidatus Paceibacterota bacterium]HPC37322.1 hypothetical protein [Candidatus Paceibacterota bacterium]